MNVTPQISLKTPIILMLCLAGCDRPQEPRSVTRNDWSKVAAFQPETFREDLNSFILRKEYAAATAYLKSADASWQAQFDKAGYLAVGEDWIDLPGVAPPIYYDQERDWFMPGTSDAIEDMAWQQAATEFAEEYNRARINTAESHTR